MVLQKCSEGAGETGHRKKSPRPQILTLLRRLPRGSQFKRNIHQTENAIQILLQTTTSQWHLRSKHLTTSQQNPVFIKQNITAIVELKLHLYPFIFSTLSRGKFHLITYMRPWLPG